MNSEIDVQLVSIRNGLDALTQQAEDPAAQEALDVAHSIQVARTIDLLRRLRHSLRQYAERGKDLYYVACVGHFSSGKSSTINSVFQLWNTPQQRAVDLNPTDTAITLLTDASNEQSVLGVSREGIVPIRTRYIDHALLANLVIADTPGTGDPQELQEIARQFLPLCDLVLFFFSATSPFDVTDLPLLTELRASLPFIPIKFVVTRADEFSKNRRAPLTVDNFNDESSKAFTSDVAVRLNTAAGFGLAVSPADFFILDNKEAFQIEALRAFLLAKTNQESTEARIKMHSHKVQFFRHSASECLTILKTRLSEQFDDIDRIVTTARKNVERFQDCIMPSTLTITKRWTEELERVISARMTELAAVPQLRQLPTIVMEMPQVGDSVRRLNNYIQHDANVKAARLEKHCAMESTTQVNLYLIAVQHALARFDIRRPEELIATISQAPKICSNLEPSDLQFPAIAAWIDEVRQDCSKALESALLDTRDSYERLDRRIGTGAFAKMSEAALDVASEVLGLELEKYFEIVMIYHGSVFARHVKEAIARAGLGRRLDALEHEISVEHREAMKIDARAKLLGNFEIGLAAFRTSTLSLMRRSSELRASAVEKRFEIPAFTPTSPVPFESLHLNLDEQVTANVASNVEAFVASVSNEVGTEVLGATKRFADEQRELSLQRKKHFAYLMLAGTVVGFVAFVLYRYFGAPVDQTLGRTLLYGALSSLLGNALGFIIAKATSGFSKVLRSSATQQSEALRIKLSEICTSKKEAFEPGKLGDAGVLQQLSRLTTEHLTDALNADKRAYVLTAIEALNVLRDGHEKIRADYISGMNALVQCATQCLGEPQKATTTLKDIAAEIRTREISPSFDVLDETRNRYSGVKEGLDAITFG